MPITNREEMGQFSTVDWDGSNVMPGSGVTLRGELSGTLAAFADDFEQINQRQWGIDVQNAERIRALIEALRIAHQEMLDLLHWDAPTDRELIAAEA